MKRLLSDFPQYKPVAISAPGSSNPRVRGTAPWIITLSNFLSDAEVDAFIGSCQSHFERSLAGDQLSPVRTSQQCWCADNECGLSPLTRAVEERVRHVLDVPTLKHFEPFQVLRYQEGQFYKVHHDQNSPRASAWGPRMFTVFLYIGDGYEGGETHFPRLNITVAAKKGQACVWTSVLDSDPNQRDDRTDHESLPVTGGVKFGVNYWIHMYPFRTFKGRCGNQAYIQNWR